MFKTLFIFKKKFFGFVVERNICIFASQFEDKMRKVFLFSICAALLLSGCSHEFNLVYKSQDYDYKYEYAKECFAVGKYQRAITLLTELVTIEKGRENGQECLYMLAMAEYLSKDYEGAAETFKKYCSAYPRGYYAEMASFYTGQSLFMSTPEPRLDQTPTVSAISAFQEFLDLYPEAKLKGLAQDRLFSLQSKLVKKEYLSAKLYYNLGSYFGNCTNGGSNYEACIITAENALKDYPYTNMREDFALLIMKSKFDLAEQSIEAKRIDRYRDAEDECYGFLNEYPDSKNKKLAEKYIAICKKYTKD